MDVRLRESYLASVNYFFIGETKVANFPRTNGDLTTPIPTVLLLCQRAMYFC